MKATRIGLPRRVLASCVASLFVVSGPLRAECVAVLTEAHTTAKILSCQSLEIGPSNARIPSYKEAPDEGEAQRYFDHQVARFSGTLLLVELLSDASDSHGSATSWPVDWKKGKSIPLISSQPASKLCKIDSMIEVMPDQVCCDTYPRNGDCIFPSWLRIRRALITPAGESPR